MCNRIHSLLQFNLQHWWLKTNIRNHPYYKFFKRERERRGGGGRWLNLQIYMFFCLIQHIQLWDLVTKITNRKLYIFWITFISTQKQFNLKQGDWRLISETIPIITVSKKKVGGGWEISISDVHVFLSHTMIRQTHLWDLVTKITKWEIIHLLDYSSFMAEFIQNLFSTPLKEGITKSSNAMRRKVFHLPSSSSR